MSMKKGTWHRVDGKLVRRRGLYKQREEAVHQAEVVTTTAAEVEFDRLWNSLNEVTKGHVLASWLHQAMKVLQD